MSAIGFGAEGQFAGDRKAFALAVLRQRAKGWLDGLIGVWIFAGGLVLIEPSPYEVVFLAVLPLALFAGIAMFRSTLGLLAILLGFIPFALIGAFQSVVETTQSSLEFVAITVFLLLTAYFLANYAADKTLQRVRLIMTAYTAIAIIAALIGTLAYLGVLPGRDLFLLYGRAKGTFKDPNVFAPFLILPAVFALQRALLLRGRRAFWAGAVFMVLFVGVFVSFSRAAWGNLAITSIMVTALVFILEAKARDKVRIIILTMVGVIGMLVALAALVSIPAVSSLLSTRLESQNYDTGESGRFGRQGYAWDLALEHPWGIGPSEFGHLRINEAPHDTYVTVLHHYGWGGGALYFILVLATLWRGYSTVFRPSPYRLLMIPLIATFTTLVGEAVIIDIDHWRHYFLIAGLIWGVSTAIRNSTERSAPRSLALV